MGFYPAHGFQNQTKSFFFVAENTQRHDMVQPRSCARSEISNSNQQIWSSNTSYHLPRKSCEYLSGVLERAHGILISVKK